MNKDDRDKRVEETLKFSSSGTTQTDLEAILGFRTDSESTFLQKDLALSDFKSMISHLQSMFGILGCFTVSTQHI